MGNPVGNLYIDYIVVVLVLLLVPYVSRDNGMIFFYFSEGEKSPRKKYIGVTLSCSILPSREAVLSPIRTEKLENGRNTVAHHYKEQHKKLVE